MAIHTPGELLCWNPLTPLTTFLGGFLSIFYLSLHVWRSPWGKQAAKLKVSAWSKGKQAPSKAEGTWDVR